MSEALKGKNPALTAISNGATFQITRRNFSKLIEVVASVILFAVLGLMFADGLTNASGHFGPGPEIAVQLAGGVHE